MNFLAHAYLSFHHDEVLIGNMISDFVKGNKKLLYDSNIQNGITLHRLIDAFTDTHEATQHAKTFFRQAVGLYAGAFVDVVYDHFLATDTAQFADAGQLSSFTKQVYHTLYRYESVLPYTFRSMLPYMRNDDWLFNYRFKAGIEKSFEGVVRRARYLHNSVAAYQAFENHYDALQQCYNLFFGNVKSYAAQQLNLLQQR
jgi:acyl carrier protein phosphodiesterase